MDMPEIRYARSSSVRIAYQVTGSGALDLVFVPGFISNLEAWWDEPEWAHLRSRLAGFSRLILFDKRGTGLSDELAELGVAAVAKSHRPGQIGREVGAAAANLPAALSSAHSLWRRV